MLSKERLSDAFKSVDASVGTVIEVTPETYEILGGLYSDEHIVARSVEVLDKDIFKVTYKFPEYKLVPGLEHVSGVQMQLGLFQGLFLAIGLYVKQGDGIINYETFLHNRKTAKYRRESKEYTNELKFGEEGFLVFKIDSISEIKGFYKVNIKLLHKMLTDTTGRKTKTFMRGECECILEKFYV